MDIWQYLFLAVIAAGVRAVFRIPKQYLLGYGDWVRTKHGVWMNISAVVLLLVLAPCLVIALAQPDKYPVIEYIAYSLLPLLVGLIAWDNWRFWQTEYRHNS